MNRPFSRRFMLCLVVVSMLLTSALWATPATVHAQDEGYAGDVPVELIDPASILGPDFSAAPGEGPSLPAEETPASGLTPDGRPVDSLAPQAVPPDQPELDSSQLGVLGADPGANAPVDIPSADSFTYPGVSFNHVSRSDNITALVTYLDSPSLNEFPDRSLLATVLLNPLGATTSYHNHTLGVYYDSAAAHWSVFNEDSVTMTANVAFNVFRPAQNSVFFTHTATAANTLFDLTLINNAYLNNNPNALVFAIPAYNPGGGTGSYYNHHVGTYYDVSNAKWGIYNEDLTAVTADSKFFVYVSQPAYDVAFKHITTAASTIANYTVLDHPLLNNNPNAVINVTHEYHGDSERLNQALGVWYSNTRGRWTIYLNSSTTMPDGFDFNVLVQANREAQFVFKADASNIQPGINDHVAVIDHPFLNNNPNALVYAIHNWNPAGSTIHQVDNHPLGVLYMNNHWTVYHTDFEAILPNSYYNIYATYPKANAYSFEAGSNNTTASTMRLNHPQLNNHPDAIYITTLNFNPGEATSGFSYGYATYAAYGSGIWNILRVGGPDFVPNQAYNMLIPEKHSFVHIVTAGSKPAPAETCMNNPLINNNNSAIVLAYVNGTPAGGGGYYLNKPIGVYYRADRSQWCLYVEDTTVNIPLGTAFNVFVAGEYLYIPIVKK